MADDSSNRRLIVVLASALAASLLVIAFLLGRLSGQSEHARRRTSPTDALPVAPEAESAPRELPALAAEPRNDAPVFAPVEPERTAVLRIDRRPDGRIVLSNTEPAEPSSASAQEDVPDTPDAVRSYLQQMSVIHSAEGAGDPNAFAMQLIKAGLGGASSGFDRLIDDTKRMEAEIRSLTPPPVCERYHEASLQGVVESRKMLEDLKTAITKRDIDRLVAIAREAGRLQEKADALKAMEQEIRAGL